MAEAKKLDRLGDLYPQIMNCYGGTTNDHLMGNLTHEEIQQVKALTIASTLAYQVALTKTQECQVMGQEVEIAYYPTDETVRAFQEGIAICALCCAKCNHQG